MEEEVKIKYIEDIKDIVTPCYVTSDGDVYQISPDGKTMELRNKNYIKKINKVVVTLRNKKCCKSVARQVILDSLVYKSFATEKITLKRLKITHKDGDIYNCCVDNLVHNVFDRAEYNRNYRQKKQKQKYKKTLKFNDFNSCIEMLKLRTKYKTNSENFVIDTTGWEEDNINYLKRLKLDAGVKIK